VHVGGDAPGAAEALAVVLDGFDEVVPGGRGRIVLQAFDGGAQGLEQAAHGGFHVGRLDRVEARQAGQFEKGRGGGGGGHFFREQSVEWFHFAEFRAECRLCCGRRKSNGRQSHGTKGTGVTDKALNLAEQAFLHSISRNSSEASCVFRRRWK
jgi:hypothetical protein